MTLVQAPAGASLDYTSGIARQVEAILIKTPEVLGVFSVMGFSFSGAAPSQGMIFRRSPFDERKGDEHSAQAIITRLRGPLFGIPGPSSCRWRRRRSRDSGSSAGSSSSCSIRAAARSRTWLPPPAR